MQFATMFSQDAITLAWSDALLVLSTGICVPFAKALKNGWISYYWTGLILQHILQTSILFGAISWTFNRNWPWVQSGFLTLHSIVMVMKMHSYITVNGQLQDISRQAQKLRQKLEKATESVGGWHKAMALAAEKQAEFESISSSNNSPPNGLNGRSDTPVPIGTPLIPKGATSSFVDVKTANQLRKRLTAVAAQSNLKNTHTNGHVTSPNMNDPSVQLVHKLQTRDGTEPSTYITQDDDSELPEGVMPNPLIHHPDSQISALAKDYSELQAEMVSTGPEYVKWPQNISWKNFALYQLIPSLVYELEYPRTDRIRPLYLFEKTVATFGTFALLYTVTESFILPYTSIASQKSFLRSLLDLALPFMMAYLLLFFIIFECICNGFAELSCFADRQFYEDWYDLSLDCSLIQKHYNEYRWNSTSWDEFSRKWNKPVHTFLLRHVYAATIMSYKFSKTTAMFVTFLLSACVHELVMAVVTRKFRMYLFILQLIQIPLIMIGRIPAIKRNKLMGNVVFWLGLYAGFPLLCVAYIAY
ncbi:MBOAT, membrane-bound O-acyltransferase family-domain-containing protein [Panaeolus papilionaceus]|nr:MBOAT, membrane-bound O-acyltransferase family-domain-containing protein [Panaeolus papilionaceus]